jgi:hypothetical protein
MLPGTFFRGAEAEGSIDHEKKLDNAYHAMIFRSD